MMNYIPQGEIAPEAEQAIVSLIDLLMKKYTQKAAIVAMQDVARETMDSKFTTKEVALILATIKPTGELKGETRRETITVLLTETFETILNNRKGNTMNTSTATVTPINDDTPEVKAKGNVIDLILENNRTDDEIRLALKVAVNAATSSAISLAMMVARANRNSVPDTPTLEKRNQQDMDNEPRPIETEIDSAEPEMTYAAQFSLTMDLRESLIEAYSPLIRQHNGAPDKYDVLMSPADFLEFRIRMSGIVDAEAVKRGAIAFEETEDLVREIMAKDAIEQQARLNDIKGETLDLIKSFNEWTKELPSTLFDRLPAESRERITDRIAEKINGEYKRLFPIALRNGDLEITSLMTLYKAMYQDIKAL